MLSHALAPVLLALLAAPAGNAFYAPPSPLPPATHGQVIWQRPLTGGAVLPSAAKNFLILYHTVGPKGTDVAVSGSLAVPRGTPPKGGWPVISWTHGTTGDAPQCAPSRDKKLNVETRLADAFVAHGYAVARTDYEGQATPGVHPYFIETAYVHDAADMVRAAREVDASIGTRWIVAGHSEGGTAAIATATLGATWTPELKLLGAISYAPASQLTYMLDNMLHATKPLEYLPFFALMVKSFSSYDNNVHLEKTFTLGFVGKLRELESQCVDDLLADQWWTSRSPSQVFLEHPDLGPISQDFIANEPGALHPTVPVLLVQGIADQMVSADATRALAQELCHNGTAVTLDFYAGKNHGTVLTASMQIAFDWVSAVFGGTVPASNCGLPPSMF